MEHKEILPEPESVISPEKAGASAEFVDEKQQSKVLETNPAAAAGLGAMHSATVSGAQQHVNDVQTTGATSTPASVSATADMTAEDVDLIEKEWVKRAKDIVEKTINDPQAQSEELSKVKADYIKKRYNRDVATRDSEN